MIDLGTRPATQVRNINDKITKLLARKSLVAKIFLHTWYVLGEGCTYYCLPKNVYMFDTPWCIGQTSSWHPNAFGAILLLEGPTHIFRRLYEKMFWKLWTETNFHWRISPHSQGGWYIHIFRKGKKVPVFILLNVQVDSLLLWDSETCLPADCSSCRKSRHLHSRSRTITLYGLLAPARAHYIMKGPQLRRHFQSSQCHSVTIAALNCNCSTSSMQLSWIMMVCFFSQTSLAMLFSILITLHNMFRHLALITCW